MAREASHVAGMSSYTETNLKKEEKTLFSCLNETGLLFWGVNATCAMVLLFVEECFKPVCGVIKEVVCRHFAGEI